MRHGQGYPPKKSNKLRQHVTIIAEAGVNHNGDLDKALKLIEAAAAIGVSFYILVAGLAISAIYNIVVGHKPETTLPGLIISIISIAIMWALVTGKRKVGHELESQPILSDANCTMVCIYMSVVLLASSLIYQLTGFGFIDSIGTLGLIWFSYNEGREAFEKAAGLECDCEDEECKA